MQITSAEPGALIIICELYQTVIADMCARELYQWEWNRYPSEALLREDIKQGRLFRMDDDNGLAGVFALVTGGFEPEYREVDWWLGGNPVCLHRIAVLPNRGGRGYAAAAVAFAKEYGRRNGCNAFRVDTYAENTRALKFFRSVTAREAGIFHLQGFAKPYYCFESTLQANA